MEESWTHSKLSLLVNLSIAFLTLDIERWFTFHQTNWEEGPGTKMGKWVGESLKKLPRSCSVGLNSSWHLPLGLNTARQDQASWASLVILDCMKLLIVALEKFIWHPCGLPQGSQVQPGLPKEKQWYSNQNYFIYTSSKRDGKPPERWLMALKIKHERQRIFQGCHFFFLKGFYRKHHILEGEIWPEGLNFSWYSGHSG